MALDAICLDLLKPHLRGSDILCLAYPDVVVRQAMVELILGIKVTETTPHGAAHKREHPLPETLHVLRQAGAKLIDVCDVKRIRGMEQVRDLNKEQEWHRQYDLVINPGTLEHCFDVAQAWRNAWYALKVGGTILHVAPATMLNHGFWSMNPTLYFDFAAANGGVVLNFILANLEGVILPFEAQRRFSAPPNAVIYCLMQKVEEHDIVNPTQWKYR